MATRSWNRVELIGNLTRDPELRYTPQGTAVATFSIATNRTFVTEGEKREEADFHRIVAWSKLAELCSQLLKKGNRVFVSSRLQNRSWEGQDGQQRQTTEIVIEDMILLTSRGDSFGGDFNEDVSREESQTQRLSTPQASSKKQSSDDGNPTREVVEDKKPAKNAPADEDPGDLDDLPF